MAKKSKLVIVHGVQTGDNEDAVKGPKQMNKALERYIAGRLDYSAAFPAYEEMNDEAQKKFRTISKLILKALKSPVGPVFDKLVDLVGDVFVYRDDDNGDEIRAQVRKTIEANRGCVLVGHSLGSVVCFDIVMEMMQAGQFDKKTRAQWPVKSLITFGSPLALDMFKNSRDLVRHGGKGPFHWYNYSDRNDPIISGNVFGSAFEQNRLMRDTYVDAYEQFRIHDRQVETGFHLLAHINYWQQKHIIMRIAEQLS